MNDFDKAILVLKFLKLSMPKDLPDGELSNGEITKIFDLAIESIQMRQEAEQMLNGIGAGGAK